MSDQDKQAHEQNPESSTPSNLNSPAGQEWQSTVDAIPDIILILDNSFRIVRCNKAALEHYGLPREKIEGRLCWQVTHSSNEPHAQCPVIAMQRSLKRERAVLQMRGGHFEITADPILDSEGNISGAIHLISDVSDRIDAVSELKEANLLYQDIIDNQSAGIYRIRCLMSGNWADLENPPYQYEFLNDRYTEITGLSREALMADASATMKLVHPDDLDSWIFLNQKADSTLEVFRWEGRFIVNGQIKWIHFESRPRVLFSGDRVWTGVLLDITELKHSEEALRDSEEKFRTIFENSKDGILLLTVDDCKLTMLNHAVMEIFDLKSSNDMIAHTPWDFSPERQPDGRLSMEKGMEMVEDTMKHGVTFFEWTHRKSNGSLFFATILLSKITIGGKIAILATIRDITAQKKAEEERLILEGNLRHSEKMQAVGHLAGGIAHDFNNQLMGIMGYAEMIFHKAADPEIREFATSILSASRRGSDLTRKLLAFSRKGKYHAVPVDLHEIILEVVKILEHSIDKKIMITHELGAGQSVVSGDPTQIQNALLNLGINSRDAMPQGGELSFQTENLNMEDVPKLHARHRSVQGACIKICVRDTGYGMDDETMKHVFEPFFSTKPAEKGSGMGLASVYGTVKSHKGYVYAESEPGTGTSFSIYLPIADLPVPANDSKPELKTGTHNGLRILLADDDEVVRKMLSRMLANFGHQVVTAGDGVEAVEIYKNSFSEIDLVLIDMVMPRMNGKEAFFEMQKINAGIKALMISGFSIDGEVQELLKSGMKGFLQKPFEISGLSKMIAEVIAS